MLHLYLIRHAEAVPQGDSNYDDDDRPLTDAGRLAARQLGAALTAHGIHFDLVLSSPLPRARQTAEEMVDGMGEPAPPVEFADELACGAKPKKIDRLLLKYDDEAIAVVGHQPDLGEYAGRLIGSKKTCVDFEKPGIACIACEDPPGKRCGTLLWLLTPAWCAGPTAPAQEPIRYAGRPGGTRTTG
jgi:phosphohistidine phosphatase